MKLARLAATLMAVAALAACSDDPEPIVEPSETPATAESTQPPDPRQTQREFVRTYVEEMSESLSSGDSSGFLGLSTEQCNNCEMFADNLRNAYSNGGRIVGGRWILDRLDFGGETGAGALWFVDVRSTRERWINADGDTVNDVPAGVQLLAMTVTTNAATPQMADIQFRTP